MIRGTIDVGTGDRTVVMSVDGYGGFKYVRDLKPGELFVTHPTKGIIITHPERPPLHVWLDLNDVVHEEEVRITYVGPE